MKKTGKTGRKELFMNAKTKEKKTIMNALLGGEADILVVDPSL